MPRGRLRERNVFLYFLEEREDDLKDEVCDDIENRCDTHGIHEKDERDIDRGYVPDIDEQKECQGETEYN